MKIDKYYKGSYFGRPVAGLIYTLCQQLSREDNAALWLWILGLTEQLLSFKISQKTYAERASEVQREVIRLNLGIVDRSRPLPEDVAAIRFSNDRKFGSILFQSK